MTGPQGGEPRRRSRGRWGGAGRGPPRGRRRGRRGRGAGGDRRDASGTAGRRSASPVSPPRSPVPSSVVRPFQDRDRLVGERRQRRGEVRRADAATRAGSKAAHSTSHCAGDRRGRTEDQRGPAEPPDDLEAHDRLAAAGRHREVDAVVAGRPRPLERLEGQDLVRAERVAEGRRAAAGSEVGGLGHPADGRSRVARPAATSGSSRRRDR